MPPKNAVAAGTIAPVAVPTAARATTPGIARIAPRNTGKRFVIYGVPGVGKTSLVAGAENSLIVSIGNETGYQTLVDSGLAPERDYAHVQSWETLYALLDSVAKGQHVYSVVALDALSNLGVMAEDYAESNKASNENFWHKLDAILLDFLSILDIIRERGTHVVLLAHSTVGLYKNPDGDDYNTYQIDCLKRFWPMVEKWADAVLFYCFQVVVKNEGQSASKTRKGQGGQTRMLRCSNKAAWVAKNRLGLPEELIVLNDPTRVWDWFIQHALHAQQGE